MSQIDQHCHTTASDWNDTHYQLIEYAKEKWLEALFITDHDKVSFDTIEDIRISGLHTVPSVEITTIDPERFWEQWKDIHMTYYANKYSDELLGILEKKEQEKQNYVRDFVEYLRLQGFDISDENFYWTYYIAAEIVSNAQNTWKLRSIGLDWETSKNILSDFYRWFLNKSWKLHLDFISQRGHEYFKPALKDISELLQWNGILSFAHPNFTFERQHISWFLELYREFYLPKLWISAIEINTLASNKWVDAILTLKENNPDIQLTFGSDCHEIRSSDKKHGDLWFENNFLDEAIIQREFHNFRGILWI